MRRATSGRRICWCLVVIFLGMTSGWAARAEEPGKVTSTSSVMRIGDFQGMALLEIDEKPAACFGLHKLPGGKPRFTYLLLFKPDPKAERGSGVGGGGSVTLSSTGE